MSAAAAGLMGRTSSEGDGDSVDESVQAASAQYDVTAWLLQSSCALPAGHFLHAADGSFSLHGVMSALELMDARMDPGMANPQHDISSQQRRRVPSSEQQQQWDDRQVLLCADTLLCTLASHLNGLSLPHSLYTLTLLHHAPYQHHRQQQQQSQPSSSAPPAVFPLLQQPQLRLLARLLLHTAHACRSMVSRADLYEEEEWNMHDYGLSVEREAGEVPLSKEATAAEQALEAALKLDRKGKQTAGEPSQSSATTYREAVLDRIRLCHALLLLLSHLSKPSAALHTAHKLLARAATHLHSVMHATAMAPQSAAQHVRELDAFRASAECPFDPALAASLILHAPPRVHPLLPFTAALTLLHQLLTHTSLLLASSSLVSLPPLLSFVSYFASQRPNIVLRSLLLLSLVDEQDVNRSGRPLLALLSDALHSLSPSAALFSHPSTRWAVFGPLPAGLPSELSAVPPSDLYSSWMAGLSTVTLQHFRLLLMDPTRERRKVGSTLQLVLHLQPAARSVDEWLALACRRLRVEQADSAWHAVAVHLAPQQRKELEEAARRSVYGSSYYSLAVDAGCSLLLHQLTSLFAQQLNTDEELSTLYFAVQQAATGKVNNAVMAWRDGKLSSALLDGLQHNAPASASAAQSAARKTRGKQQQQQQAHKALSVTPPLSAELLLWESVALLSAAMQALIHGMARLRVDSAPASLSAVSVPLLPAASLSTYFSSRFPWLPEQLVPRVTASLYSRAMQDEFAPSVDAQQLLATSGMLFGKAKEGLAALQRACKQQPPLPACTSEALVGQSAPLDAQPAHSAVNGSHVAAASPVSASLPSARVALLTDFNARTVLPFDGAFVHSLARVVVANAVTAATLQHTVTTHSAAESATEQSGETRSPFRARFNFATNWLFPIVTVEPARSRPAASAIQ